MTSNASLLSEALGHATLPHLPRMRYEAHGHHFLSHSRTYRELVTVQKQIIQDLARYDPGFLDWVVGRLSSYDREDEATTGPPGGRRDFENRDEPCSGAGSRNKQ
ncbi:unnamed protein product, partial [Amoebophrya sp. A120]|eukprot:GSA120T00019068001.1